VDTEGNVLSEPKSRGDAAEGKQSKEESMVSEANTVLNERAVVVHFRDAGVAGTAVMSPHRFIHIRFVVPSVFFRHFAFGALFETRRLFEVLYESAKRLRIAGGRGTDIKQNGERGEHGVERGDEMVSVAGEALACELISQLLGSRRPGVQSTL
jgi:hypothetical protein